MVGRRVAGVELGGGNADAAVAPDAAPALLAAV